MRKPTQEDFQGLVLLLVLFGTPFLILAIEGKLVRFLAFFIGIAILIGVVGGIMLLIGWFVDPDRGRH